MLKFLVVALFIFPVFALAETNLECSIDERFRESSYREIKVTFDESGKASAFYTNLPAGGPMLPVVPPVVDVKDFLIASDLTCVTSKLDGRVRQCSNPSWSETIFATLISRSEIKVLGKGNVTHTMVDELSIEVKSPVMTRTLTFPAANCVVK